MTTCAFTREAEFYLHRDGQAPNARVISILPENVPLIAHMEPEDDLYICSANVLPRDRLSVDDPMATLTACREAFKHEWKFGGPRLLTEPERAACLVSAATTNAPRAGDLDQYLKTTLQPAMLAHPAWCAGLGFATGDSMSWSLTSTLADICDILRFAKPKSQMKAQLRNYYRLVNAKFFNTNERIQFDELIHSESKGQVRLMHLVLSWTRSRLSGIPVSVAMEHLPHAFLQREMFAMREKYLAQDATSVLASNLALYRCTLRYLDFIRLTWLHGIGISTFDPFKFFRTDWEAISFVEYLARIS